MGQFKVIYMGFPQPNDIRELLEKQYETGYRLLSFSGEFFIFELDESLTTKDNTQGYGYEALHNASC